MGVFWLLIIRNSAPNGLVSSDSISVTVGIVNFLNYSTTSLECHYSCSK